VYTDAALLGAPVPGLGGFLAGRYFSFALPPGMLGYGIPQLEFLAIIAATFVFRGTLTGAQAVLVTDSITSHLSISNDGAHTAEVQWLHLELKRVIRPTLDFTGTRHVYGGAVRDTGMVRLTPAPTSRCGPRVAGSSH